MSVSLSSIGCCRSGGLRFWKVKSTKDRADYLIERITDHLTLCVHDSSYGHNGMLYVSLVRPVGRDGNRPTIWENDPLAGMGTIHDPVIYMSNTKSPEQIAKDISRRLMPEAERVMALALKAIEKENQFEDDKIATINELAEVVNNQPDRHYQSHKLTGKISPYTGVEQFQKFGYGGFTVNAGDSVTLELVSMSKDVAIQVARAIRGIFLST